MSAAMSRPRCALIFIGGSETLGAEKALQMLRECCEDEQQKGSSYIDLAKLRLSSLQIA